MWYHYLLLIAGMALVGFAIYSIVAGPRSVTSLAMNGVQIAIGGGIAYYGYSGINALPATPPPIIPPAMIGGLRKLFRK